jgi:hypothetical protein
VLKMSGRSLRGSESSSPLRPCGRRRVASGTQLDVEGMFNAIGL